MTRGIRSGIASPSSGRAQTCCCHYCGHYQFLSPLLGRGHSQTPVSAPRKEKSFFIVIIIVVIRRALCVKIHCIPAVHDKRVDFLHQLLVIGLAELACTVLGVKELPQLLGVMRMLVYEHSKRIERRGMKNQCKAMDEQRALYPYLLNKLLPSGIAHLASLL